MLDIEFTNHDTNDHFGAGITLEARVTTADLSMRDVRLLAEALHDTAPAGSAQRDMASRALAKIAEGRVVTDVYQMPRHQMDSAADPRGMMLREVGALVGNAIAAAVRPWVERFVGVETAPAPTYPTRCKVCGEQHDAVKVGGMLMVPCPRVKEDEPLMIADGYSAHDGRPLGKVRAADGGPIKAGKLLVLGRLPEDPAAPLVMTVAKAKGPTPGAHSNVATTGFGIEAWADAVKRTEAMLEPAGVPLVLTPQAPRDATLDRMLADIADDTTRAEYGDVEAAAERLVALLGIEAALVRVRRTVCRYDDVNRHELRVDDVTVWRGEWSADGATWSARWLVDLERIR